MHQNQVQEMQLQQREEELIVERERAKDALMNKDQECKDKIAKYEREA